MTTPRALNPNPNPQPKTSMVYQKKSSTDDVPFDPPPKRLMGPDGEPLEFSFGTHVGKESGLLPPGMKVAVPEGDYVLLCSACFQTSSGKDAHVIPWWNVTMSDFFTTFRCSKCWLESLDETDAKVKRMTSDIRYRFCEFLRRHKFNALAAEIEAAPLPKSSAKILAFLKQIRNGEVFLKP
jgi:hypothetical protein